MRICRQKIFSDSLYDRFDSRYNDGGQENYQYPLIAYETLRSKKIFSDFLEKFSRDHADHVRNEDREKFLGTFFFPGTLR